MIKEFINAVSVGHAVEMGKRGYVFLAGGTQVNSTPFRKWNRPVERVISLYHLKLGGIRTQDGNTVVGAMTTLQDIADSGLVPNALRKAASFIPTRSVRNIATIGGNVGADRTDSYIIPVLLALGTRLKNAAGAEMSVETYLQRNSEDLILEFIVPPLKGVCAAVKESRSYMANPVVTAAVRLAAEGNKITEAAVYAGSVADRVVKLPTVEQAILDGMDVEQAVKESIHPQGSILGSADFKRYLNAVKIADAVEKCGKEMFS
ncbi:MAG: hypothetical protein B6D68_03055 [spirochete symbiont of Stewartia floridana]|nr:MAG: hypothetical protein B6D68_03055 [spirochete symbiont of Stewartia floridana]